jgi:methyltransferase
MFAALVIVLLCQRAAELFLAEKNRRWALERGGKESGQDHYPLIVGMHALFYVSLVLEYRYLSKGWNSAWPFWLALLILTQLFRVWCIASLGRFWNTRIIVIPGVKRVTTGPYRWLRHPNYVVVAVEILIIPVLCGCYLTALAFTLANLLVLRIRIREEESALEELTNDD